MAGTERAKRTAVSYLGMVKPTLLLAAQPPATPGRGISAHAAQPGRAGETLLFYVPFEVPNSRNAQNVLGVLVDGRPPGPGRRRVPAVPGDGRKRRGGRRWEAIGGGGCGKRTWAPRSASKGKHGVPLNIFNWNGLSSSSKTCPAPTLQNAMRIVWMLAPSRAKPRNLFQRERAHCISCCAPDPHPDL